MARPKADTPAYCLHKRSGRAYVTLSGSQRVLPGLHGSDESRAAYDRLIAEWLRGGRTLPATGVTGPTVSMVALAFWTHAQARYVRPDGTPTGEAENFRLALRVLRRLYGNIPAEKFGPKALKALRTYAITDRTETDPETGKPVTVTGWSRTYANRQAKRVQQVFRWAASEELIPPTVPAALDTVGALPPGTGRETDPVEPVADELVDATLRLLPPPVRAMVQLQRLTGARGGELFTLRTCDLDTGGEVWTYRPAGHKTAHKGHKRVVYFGPQAQDVLRPFLRADLTAYLFQPAEAAEWRNECQRAKRRTPMTPSHRARAARAKARPKRYRPRYSKDVYANAVARACVRAFPVPADLTAGMSDTDAAAAITRWRTEHHWHPHQLRHTAGTTYRREGDFETAKILLGHRTDAMTQHYAERDARKAAELIARIG